MTKGDPVANLQLCIIAAGMLITVCSCGREETRTEQQLRNQAAALPLPERYELYLDVYFSRVPRNPILADDVAQLGEPARVYVIERALNADVAEFGAALAVVAAFDRTCSSNEYSELLGHADMISSYAKQTDALVRQVRVACNLAVPQGVSLGQK